MGKKQTIILDGNNLTIDQLCQLAFVRDIKVEIGHRALRFMRRVRKFVDREMNLKIVYGINTGFGPMASHVIGGANLRSLQANLVRSHAVGTGNPLANEFVIATMLVRLNTLVKGYSGVSLGVVKQLQTFINKRIIPVVPEHGAVGTSGDLVHLAHIALALMGEGEVFYNGKKQKTKNVLKELRIKPYQLKAKEGLSLINGTSAMTAMAALLCVEAERLLSVAVRSGAFSLELVHGLNDSLSAVLHRLRPHRGQVVIAKVLRNLLKTSHLLYEREDIQERVKITGGIYEVVEKIQDVYSLRCIPQILGPILETLENVKKVVEVEINSVSDNPIVDIRNKLFLHGGNFHGDYVATALDQLKAAMVKLSLLSERRINFFLNNRLNRMFPPFLNLNKPGLTLALQGLQFVATSTAAQNQTLAFPHSVHSIPTNADNQDVVSMGTDAALFAHKVLENNYTILAVELIVLAQATDYLKDMRKLSVASKLLFRSIRKYVAKVVEDRPLNLEIERLIKSLKSTKDFDIEFNNKRFKL